MYNNIQNYGAPILVPVPVHRILNKMVPQKKKQVPPVSVRCIWEILLVKQMNIQKMVILPSRVVCRFLPQIDGVRNGLETTVKVDRTPLLPPELV